MTTLLELLRRYWKPLAVLTILILVWLHGDHHGMAKERGKWELFTAKQTAARAMAYQLEEAKAREEERKTQAFVNLLADQGLAALTEKQREIEAMRSGVDAGRIRLRIAAGCPTVTAEAAGSAGVDSGPEPELNPAARPAYYALRAGIEEQSVKLSSCQAILDKLTSPSATR